MIIKFLEDYDIVNYKKPSMFIGFCFCSFKCDKEYGEQVCQNSDLAHAPNIEISIEKLIQRYLDNPLTHAICCGGLEPFDSWDELYEFCKQLRYETDDDIVIYTGYTEDEIDNQIQELSNFKNIIIKFGRYNPKKGIKFKPLKFDEVLGVYLASRNQYAKKIS